MRLTHKTQPGNALKEAHRLEQLYGESSGYATHRKAVEAMSEDDLFNYIVLKTFDFGRTWEGSIENAISQTLSSSRDELNKMFGGNREEI